MGVLILIVLILIFLLLLPFTLTISTARGAAKDLNSNSGFTFRTFMVILGINFLGPWIVGFLFGSDIKIYSRIVFLVLSALLFIYKIKQSSKNTKRLSLREDAELNAKNEKKVENIKKSLNNEEKKETAKIMNLFGDELKQINKGE